MEKKDMYAELKPLANNNATITFTPALSSVDLSDRGILEGSRPYELVSPFSRFKIAVIENATSKVASANLSCREDLSTLYHSMKDALTCIHFTKWGVFGSKSAQASKQEQKPAEKEDLSTAYTVRFLIGTYGQDKKPLKGISPAELLMENPSNKSVLEAQKKYLKKAVDEGKYVEQNSLLISAIEEACELMEAGALSAEDIKKAKPLSPAYTARFRFGTYGPDKKPLAGKSPAELLYEDVANKSVLNEQYKIVYANIHDKSKEKFLAANKELLSGLIDSAKLLDETGKSLVDKSKIDEAKGAARTAGQVPGTAAEFTVFESGIRIPSVSNSGDSREYELGVYCNPAKNYPIRVHIVERKCPVKENTNGTRVADIKNASTEKETEIVLTAESFMDRVEKMYTLYKAFENQEFPKAFKRTEEIRKKRIEEAKARTGESA